MWGVRVPLSARGRIASSVNLLFFAGVCTAAVLVSSSLFEDLRDSPLAAGPSTSVMSLLQTRLTVAREEVESRRVTAVSQLSLAQDLNVRSMQIFVSSVSLYSIGAIVVLLFFAGLFTLGAFRLPVSKGDEDSICAFVASAFAVALDGIVGTVVIFILPEVGDKYGPFFLFFSRPLVGSSVACLLPLWFATRYGATRCQRASSSVGAMRLIARKALTLGLALSALSCLLFALALTPFDIGGRENGAPPPPEQFALRFVSFPAVVLGSLASVCILLPALSGAILAAPSPSSTGGRLATVLAARSLGASCGPTAAQLVERIVFQLLGIRAFSAVLAFLGVLSAVLCLMHASLYAQGGRSVEGVDLAVGAAAIGRALPWTHNSFLRTSRQVFGEARTWMLLSGLGLVSANLSLNSVLFPLVRGAGFEGPVLGVAAVVQVLATIAAGLATDLLGQKWSGHAAMASLAAAACGLRAAALHAGSQVAAHAAFGGLDSGSVGLPVMSLGATLGLIVANAGLGMYLGLSLPQLVSVVQSIGCSSALGSSVYSKSARDGACVAQPPAASSATAGASPVCALASATMFEAPLGIAALIASSAVTAVLFLGNGLGAALQMAVYSKIGYVGTLQLFSAGLLGHCMAVLLGHQLLERSARDREEGHHYSPTL